MENLQNLQIKTRSSVYKLLAHRPVLVYLSAAVLLCALVWLIFGSILAPHALDQDITLTTLSPGDDGHILGTDGLGRDVWQLLIAGTRSALIGPVLIALGSLILGLIFGFISGYFGGPLDWIISRYTDLTLAMPSLLLAIVAAGVIGGGYYVSVLVMIILYSPFDIRLIRSAVRAEVTKPYIESVKVMKIASLTIMARHILPNVVVIALVNFFLNIAYGLVSMSALSYLGLGVSPAHADWGRQLADGKNIMYENAASIIAPAIAIILVSTAINALGGYIADRFGIDTES
ncbi:MAG: ABC transporter permease [Clostridiales Family XIII bacterium]|jgi:peptide/nickel transport system permease protein|nr:ABC transporter permease [Clostridiales Family XIII bacterium]